MVLYFFNLEQTVVEPRFMFVFTLHFVSFRFVLSFIRSLAFVLSRLVLGSFLIFWHFGFYLVFELLLI